METEIQITPEITAAQVDKLLTNVPVTDAEADRAASAIAHLLSGPLGPSEVNKHNIVLDRKALGKIGKHYAENDPLMVVLGQTVCEEQRYNRMISYLEECVVASKAQRFDENDEPRASTEDEMAQQANLIRAGAAYQAVRVKLMLLQKQLVTGEVLPAPQSQPKKNKPPIIQNNIQNNVTVTDKNGTVKTTVETKS